jgi:hypothetical protein
MMLSPSDPEPAPTEQSCTAGGAVLAGDPPQFRRFVSGSRQIDLEGHRLGRDSEGSDPR